MKVYGAQTAKIKEAIELLSEVNGLTESDENDIKKVLEILEGLINK